MAPACAASVIYFLSGVLLRGDDSHAAIVGKTLDIPVITGASNATQILRSGTAVTIDAEKGIVTSGEPNGDNV